MNLNLNTTLDAVHRKSVHAVTPNRHAACGTSKHRTDWKEKKMAVVNLEAALTAWKSIQNHKVNQASEMFRTNIACRTRLNPANTGYLPPNLMRHFLT